MLATLDTPKYATGVRYFLLFCSSVGRLAKLYSKCRLRETQVVLKESTVKSDSSLGKYMRDFGLRIRLEKNEKP